MRVADIIIVGAGTAGCVLAHRLVEWTNARVLLIEAGPTYPGWALNAPLAGLRLRTLWSWPLQTVPQEQLNGRRINFPMGRLVGGSSAVNAMVAAAGPAADHDSWAAAGCTGWSWAELQPCLERASGAGRGSMLSVGPPVYVSEFSHAFLVACEQDGLTRVASLTGEESETCGLFPVFQRKGGRQSAANYLDSIVPTERFLVRTRAEVRRVLFAKGRAVGVELGGRMLHSQIQARLGVVLCAGALHSPRILQSSGIGPAGLLASAGLKVEIDLPGVGLNLQDHVGAPVVVQSSQPAPGRKSQWLPAALRYALLGDGVMASNCCEAGCFLGLPGESPDIEVFTHFQTNRRPQAVELSAVLMHPQSRGTVAIDPANPFGPPKIDPRYLSEASDLEALFEGVARVQSIINQKALRNFGLMAEILPGDQDPTAFLRAHASTYYHPVGTCRMGTDELAVVDPQLKVHGAENLWVVDNSIVPIIPGGHTAATALMIGERAAELLTADRDGF